MFARLEQYNNLYSVLKSFQASGDFNGGATLYIQSTGFFELSLSKFGLWKDIYGSAASECLSFKGGRRKTCKKLLNYLEQQQCESVLVYMFDKNNNFSPGSRIFPCTY